MADDVRFVVEHPEAAEVRVGHRILDVRLELGEVSREVGVLRDAAVAACRAVGPLLPLVAPRGLGVGVDGAGDDGVVARVLVCAPAGVGGREVGWV